MKQPKPDVTNYVLLKGILQNKGVQEIQHYCLPARNPSKNPPKGNRQRSTIWGATAFLAPLGPNIKHCQKGRTTYVYIGYSTMFWAREILFDPVVSLWYWICWTCSKMTSPVLKKRINWKPSSSFAAETEMSTTETRHNLLKSHFCSFISTSLWGENTKVTSQARQCGPFPWYAVDAL